MLQHNCKSPSRKAHRIPHPQTERRNKSQSSNNNMHYCINPEDIKIEKSRHKITNIWNIKQYRMNIPLSLFFVDLKPAPNNIQECKIKFETPKHKSYIAQCAYCQRYGHTKNCCHLKPRSVKCAGDRSSDTPVSR
jgi:hypothetical protein